MEKVSRKNEFVVETKGRCFLCLNQRTPIKVASGRKPTHSHYSLQNLSNYLKMDLTKVFTGNDNISSRLWAKVENSQLKTELCDECVPLTDTFSELYRHLEMIEMRILDFLNLIYGRLVKTMTQQDDEKCKAWEADLGGKFQIVEVLRAEAIQKCLGKLNKFPPRIRIRKLDKKIFKREMIKQNNFTSVNHVEGQDYNINIKLEPASPGALSIDNDLNLSEDIDSESEMEVTQREGGHPSPHKSLTSNFESETDSSTPTIIPPPITVHSKSGKPIGKTKHKYSINFKTGRYKCGMCLREFEKCGSFHDHYRNIHRQVRYKCPLPACGKSFTSTSNCRKHFQVEHLGVRIPCDNCDKVFRRQGDLHIHQKTVHGETGFKCKHCSQLFSLVAERSLHIKMHCPLSPNNALATNDAKSYIAVPSPLVKDPSKPFECYICHQRFGSVQERSVHCKNHPCPHCGKRFKRITHVRDHIEAVHLGIRHKCGNPGCDKDWSDRGALYKHKRICMFQTLRKDAGSISEKAKGVNRNPVLVKVEGNGVIPPDGEEKERDRYDDA